MLQISRVDTPQASYMQEQSPGEGIQLPVPFSNSLQVQKSCETPSPGLSLSAAPHIPSPSHQTIALLMHLFALDGLSLVSYLAGLKSTRTCFARVIHISLIFVCSMGWGTSVQTNW